MRITYGLSMTREECVPLLRISLPACRFVRHPACFRAIAVFAPFIKVSNGCQENRQPGPRWTDGLRIVVLPAIQDWLGLTVVRPRIDEHLVWSLCFSHAGEKIDGC